MKIKYKIFNKLTSRWFIGVSAAILLIGTQLLPSISLLTQQASAGTFTYTNVAFNNMTVSATTGGTVCADATTTVSSTLKYYLVTFPTGFGVNSTAANWQSTNITTTTNGLWPAGAVAWPNATASTAAVASQTVTWTNASAQSMTAGTTYCFNFTFAAITQPASAANSESGTVTTQTSAPATIDTGNFDTATVTNSAVNVTASVNPNFTMSLTANSDPLGTLSTGSVSNSSASAVDVSTNAKKGWGAWVYDQYSGLDSPSASYLISSTGTPGLGSNAAALTAGTEGYNMGVTYAQTSGTCTSGSAVPATFSGAGKGGSFSSNTATSIEQIVSCGGTSNAGVITPTVYAAISGSTAAASDYTDNIYFICAGYF